MGNNIQKILTLSVAVIIVFQPAVQAGDQLKSAHVKNHKEKADSTEIKEKFSNIKQEVNLTGFKTGVKGRWDDFNNQGGASTNGNSNAQSSATKDTNRAEEKAGEVKARVQFATGKYSDTFEGKRFNRRGGGDSGNGFFIGCPPCRRNLRPASTPCYARGRSASTERFGLGQVQFPRCSS